MSPKNKKKLEIIRAKLDKLDNKLLSLIKYRTNLVKEVLKLKEFKKEIVDKKRINFILKKIHSKSKKLKIDPKITNRIWKNMILSYIDYEKRNFKKKQPEEKVSGLGVKVHGDDISKALRIFKKKVLKAGVLNEANERQFFTKKSEKKRLAKSAGRQRWLKKLRETPGPHNYTRNYRKKTGR